MKSETVKAAVIVIALTVVFAVIGRQFFKIMNISVKDVKPFVYSPTPGNSKRFLNWIIPLAKHAGAKFGLPWQALVVQCALETGWGKSSLLRTYNNFGGIKAGNNDNSVALGTKEFINGQWIAPTSKFGVWRTPYEGLLGYGNFFHRYNRYKQALNYPNDPYKFIEEIKKAGYATDPNYVTKLHGMLNQYFPQT